MSKADYKVSAFRAKYEQDLRRLITAACCVAGCINDGNTELEEIEMNDFAGRVLALVERAKRTPRKRVDESASRSDNKVIPIRA